MVKVSKSGQNKQQQNRWKLVSIVAVRLLHFIWYIKPLTVSHEFHNILLDVCLCTNIKITDIYTQYIERIAVYL